MGLCELVLSRFDLISRAFTVADVEVHCQVPSAGADSQFSYLEDFVAPPLGDRTVAEATVTGVADTRTFQELLEYVAAQVPTLRPAGERSEFSTGQMETGETVHVRTPHGDRFPDLIVLSPDHGSTLLSISREDSPTRVRHVHRHLVTAVAGLWEDLGAAVLHAAAVATPAGVVLVAGPDGAGKTSTALGLLSIDGSSLVANDRTIITSTPDGSIRAYGLPLIMRIARGTAVSTPQIARYVREHQLLRAQSTDLASLPEDISTRVKLELTPAEVAEATGRSLLSGGPVVGVVLPRIASDARSPEIRGLTPEEALPGVLDACMSPTDSGRPNAVLYRHQRSIADRGSDARELCERLAEEVPAIHPLIAPLPDHYVGDWLSEPVQRLITGSGVSPSPVVLTER